MRAIALSTYSSVADLDMARQISPKIKKLSLEERKKLALEGKRLLEAARARNKKVSVPPSSIMTSKHAPS